MSKKSKAAPAMMPLKRIIASAKMRTMSPPQLFGEGGKGKKAASAATPTAQEQEQEPVVAEQTPEAVIEQEQVPDAETQPTEAAQEQEQETPEIDDDMKIKVTLASDKEASLLSADYYVNARVGHTWVMIEDSAAHPQGIDSIGFWPLQGFNQLKPHKTVAGTVRNPDVSHTPTAKLTEETTIGKLKEGYQYAVDNINRDYNLFTYNCTDFGRKFFKKATGKKAPKAGIFGLADNPNWLHNGIEKRNKKKGLDAMGQPMNQEPEKESDNDD